MVTIIQKHQSLVRHTGSNKLNILLYFLTLSMPITYHVFLFDLYLCVSAVLESIPITKFDTVFVTLTNSISLT